MSDFVALVAAIGDHMARSDDALTKHIGQEIEATCTEALKALKTSPGIVLGAGFQRAARLALVWAVDKLEEVA